MRFLSPCMVLSLSVMAALPGCASILNGTTEQVAVNTTPAGAKCGLYRDNQRIATVDSTPGSALVDRTRHDIWLACVKSGYQPASYHNGSGTAPAVFGNIVAGGLIGVAIDVASGADNRYESPVNVSLVPAQTGAAQVEELPTSFNGTFPTTAAPVPAVPQPVAPTS